MYIIYSHHIEGLGILPVNAVNERLYSIGKKKKKETNTSVSDMRDSFLKLA